MLPLSADECRVLGTLVEKAQTTPAQYPLTLNALVTGCNQKNNRDPVTNLSEEQALDAIDSLRAKGLVREAMLSGSRVPKYRHLAREGLEVQTAELVVLAELLLRGPQAPGELRANASRMHPVESLDALDGVLKSLMGRPTPLVEEIPPPPGTRATRFAQRLCPGLHPIDAPPRHAAGTTPPRAHDASLEARVASLEAQVATLSDTVNAIARGLPEHLRTGS